MAVQTNQDIVTAAFREGNLIPVGKTPTDAENTEAFQVYQNMVASLFGNDIGELVQDWEAPPSPVSNNPSRFPLYPEKFWNEQPSDVWRNPPPNVRLVINNVPENPIYFSPTPNDGARMMMVNVGSSLASYPVTLNANGRLIEGAAEVTYTSLVAGEQVIWLYRADRGEWHKVSALELDDPSPLPQQFDDFLTCLLSVRLAPRYSATPQAATVDTAKHGHRLLKTRYLQQMNGAPMPGAWRMNTYQAYGTPWRFNGGGGFFGG